MEKRYYWFKFKEGFFDDIKIKKLRRLAGGDTYTIIYLKMMLKSLKTGGFLEFVGIEENLPKEIALEIDEDEENVSIAFKYLMSVGLIEEVDEKKVMLAEVIENTGSDSDKGLMMKRLRARRKSEVGNTLVTNVTQIEDKEKEKDKSKSRADKNSEMLYKYVCTSSLSDSVISKLNDWVIYKSEKRFDYKDMGMKSFITQVCKKVSEYGDSAVCNLIDECMGNGYEGVIWDILNKRGGKPKYVAQTSTSAIDSFLNR